MGKGVPSSPGRCARSVQKCSERVGLPRSHANAPRGAMRTERRLTMAPEKARFLEPHSAGTNNEKTKRGGLHLA